MVEEEEGEEEGEVVDLISRDGARKRFFTASINWKVVFHTSGPWEIFFK